MNDNILYFCICNEVYSCFFRLHFACTRYHWHLSAGVANYTFSAFVGSTVCQEFREPLCVAYQSQVFGNIYKEFPREQGYSFACENSFGHSCVGYIALLCCVCGAGVVASSAVCGNSNWGECACVELQDSGEVTKHHLSSIPAIFSSQ